MNKVKVVEADTKKTMDDFVALPRSIYKDCAQYVPDLDMDVRATFDPKKNAGLEFSDIQPFVAYDDGGRCVGRIAAIINHRANEKWNVRVARFGMIEFIDDADVSRALLTAVAQWGKIRGMTTVQGPMGISDFDKEGMLVEDFDLMGSMVSIYNPPYYPRHMEQMGYESHDYFTDIITFDYSQKFIVSGELYISMDTVFANSLEYKQPFVKELYRVIIHGILHMTGYNDSNFTEQNMIHCKEDELLERLNISSLGQSFLPNED